MTQPRVAPLDPPYSEAVQKSFDTIMPEGVPPLAIFRTVAHNPRVLERMVSGGLLDRGAIDLATRELVILRACARCGSRYEWGVHAAAFGQRAGFSGEQIAATWEADFGAAQFSEPQRLLMTLVDELHDSATVSDATWDRLASHYDTAQLVEIIMLAGLYHAVSFVTNALRIADEPFATAPPG